jgi:hypothetical protein
MLQNGGYKGHLIKLLLRLKRGLGGDIKGRG